MHADITKRIGPQCAEIDQPAAALVKDLKQRGLLDDTLVVFGSEFGRTPFAQGALKPGFGRDHHGGCFTWWMAGGGVKAGYSHGETDDFSYSIAKDPVHIHDFNATLLHILGHRPRAPAVPVSGPRLQADRRRGQSRQRAACVADRLSDSREVRDDASNAYSCCAAGLTGDPRCRSLPR